MSSSTSSSDVARPKPPNGDAGSPRSSARSRSAPRPSSRSCWPSIRMTADASALLGIQGVRDASPRTANASRARDPQFDSAVIGNSTGQLVKPERALAADRRALRAAHGAGHRPARAARDHGFLRAAASARRRAGDHRGCKLVRARSGAADAASVSVLALWREQARLSRAAVLLARAAARLAARAGRRWACASAARRTATGITRRKVRANSAGDRAARRWRAGARQGE